MSSAHDFSSAVLTAPPDASRRVLVTGAAGRIGSYFAEHNHARYRLRLTDIDFGDEAHAARVARWGETFTGSLNDLDFLKEVCHGIDTVVHLAGNPSAQATWSNLLDTNIVGTYNVCAAAKAAGCRRVVYASSIHAVSGYGQEIQVKTEDPVNPGDLYGVSKCFGEAMGRYLSGQEGVSFIALRIGAFQPLETALQPRGMAMMSHFVSHRDLDQLIARCIDADDKLRFGIFHGLSGNRFNRLDISDARDLLGYAPQDDFVQINPELKDVDFAGRIETVQQHSPEESGMREELR